jgi:hypothetical protein
MVVVQDLKRHLNEFPRCRSRAAACFYLRMSVAWAQPGARARIPWRQCGTHEMSDENPKVKHLSKA